MAKIIEVADYADFKDLPKDTFIITATQSLKNISLFNKAVKILSFSELVAVARKNLDKKTTITNVELKYLVNKVIDKLFFKEKSLMYKNCVDSLVELYNKLIINKISKINLQCLKKEEIYSFVEEDLFAIYTEVLKELQTNKYKTFNEAIIYEILKVLNLHDSVAFVGFVFFNDVQEAVIKMVETKALYFLNKKNDFITEELIKPLFADKGREVLVYNLKGVYNSDFSKLGENLFNNEQASVKLGEKISLFEPFANREDEFLFIAKDISNKLKSKCLFHEDFEKELKNFAIVITKNKEESIKILNDAFGRYGMFMPEITGYDNLKPVYFSKQEFLNSKLSINNKDIDYIEKIKLFNNFKRINVTGLAYRSIDFPIGQFVVEVYKILTKGLTFERFKNLINTNWYLNNVVDTDSLKEISMLNVYFKNLISLEEWQDQISKLVKLKKEINKLDEYNKHPLYVINERSLQYIGNYIKFLQRVVKELKVNGSVRQQVQNLIKTFKLVHIKAPTEEEQEMLESFVKALKNADAGDNLNIDYKYFADHIEELLSIYYENVYQTNSNLKIDVVNLDNYTKYKYVYFPMFEDNKYPSILKRCFPYTTNIVSILKKLNIEMPKNQQMNYYLKMSRHIFKNIFSFTENELKFTYINFEDGMAVGVSTYAYDIFKTAGKKLSFKKREFLTNARLGDRDNRLLDLTINKAYLNELFYRNLCAKLFYYYAKFKNLIFYSNEFLLTFYAKALLFYEFFVNLSLLGKEYTLSGREFGLNVESIFRRTFDKVLKFFYFFNENTMKDIEVMTKKRIKDFINSHIRYGNFAAAHFKLEMGKEKEIVFSNTIIKVRQTLVLVDLSNGKRTEFDISKSLDFLVSRSGGQKYSFIHYDEISDKLLNSSRLDDKMALVNYASFKVNTQLNNNRFREDGLKRVKSLVLFANESISNSGGNVSSFCGFCPLSNMCKERFIDDK